MGLILCAEAQRSGWHPLLKCGLASFCITLIYRRPNLAHGYIRILVWVTMGANSQKVAGLGSMRAHNSEHNHHDATSTLGGRILAICKSQLVFNSCSSLNSSIRTDQEKQLISTNTFHFPPKVFYFQLNRPHVFHSCDFSYTVYTITVLYHTAL